MDEIRRKPPSQIKIRTLETDVEDMRKSGGGLTSGKVLGHDLEEINQEEKKEAVTFFPTETTPLKTSPKKKFPLIIIGTVLILGLIVGFFLYKNQSQKIISSTTPTPTPQYISLLKNFNGHKEFINLNLNSDEFTKILAQQFQSLKDPLLTEEIIFVNKDQSFIPAEEILKLLFDNFNGIAISDQPKWENNFSFIVSSENNINSIGYVAKIDTKNLNTFTLAGLKGRFSLAFEKLIENNPEILSSQYLQNVGKPTSTFNSKTIGVIGNVRYIKFSSGAEFYYGFYNEYLIISTSENTFQKILEMIIER